MYGIMRLLYWKDNTLKLHTSFISFYITNIYKIIIIHIPMPIILQVQVLTATDFSHKQINRFIEYIMCECVYLCVMHQSLHIQTSMEGSDLA